MNKHTPGPWIVAGLESKSPYIVADMGNGWNNPIVCNLFDDETPDDSVTFGRWLRPLTNAHQNALLIAAAPDLLAALMALLEDQRDASLPVLAQARAAIAKATGGE